MVALKYKDPSTGWQQIGLGGGPTPAAQITRTMSHSNGGLGNPMTASGVATNLINTKDGSFRMTVRLPVTTTKWRIRIRHYDGQNGAAQTPVTGQKIVFGKDAYNTSGSYLESGTFATGPVTIVGSTFAIPGSAPTGVLATDWYVMPWETDPAKQFQKNEFNLLGIGWVGPSSQNYLMGAGRCWFWNDSTAGTGSGVGSGATLPTAYIPFDWVIDYECTSPQRAFLFVADSITEGISGIQATSGQTPTPLWRNAPAIWGRKHDVLTANISLSGRSLNSYSSAANQLWTRHSHDDAHYDGAVIGLASNDVSGSRSLQQMQDNFYQVLANTRAYVGPTAPIYAMNCIARTGLSGINTTQEGVRLDYNNWLAQWPNGTLAGIIDADSVTKDKVVSSLWTLYPPLTTDQCHLSYAGLNVLAGAYESAIKL